MVSTPYLQNNAASIHHGYQMLAWIDSVIALCRTLETYPTGEPVSEASWRTLVFNREREGIDAPADLLDSFQSWMEGYALMTALVEEGMSYAERQGTLTVPNDRNLWGRIDQYFDSWREMFQNIWSMGKVAAMEKNLVKAVEKGRRFDTAFYKFCYGRKYFKSQNGYMGWLPSTAQQGDVIVLFEDCSLPFILRHETTDNDEEGESGERYRVIGDAYVHGYMQNKPEPPYDVFEIV